MVVVVWCLVSGAPWHVGILPDQGLNLCLLHCEGDSSLSHQGKPPGYLNSFFFQPALSWRDIFRTLPVSI